MYVPRAQQRSRPMLLSPLPMFICLLFAGCANTASLSERDVLLGAPNETRRGSAPSNDAPKAQAPAFEELMQTSPQPAPVERTLPVVSGARQVKLDFVDTDITHVVTQVVKVILKLPVSIDAAVGGRMTLQTPNKVFLSELPRLLDDALVKQGYGLMAVGGAVRVGRLADLASGGRDDFQVVQIHNADPAAVIDGLRSSRLADGVNLTRAPGDGRIVISGPPAGVSSARELVRLLDSDSMQGKIFKMYKLSEAQPSAVERQLKVIFPESGRSGARVQFSAIDGQSVIIVVASDNRILEQVRQTIAKLDKQSETAIVHVRPLKFRNAIEVAELLAKSFNVESQNGGGNGDTAISPGEGSGNPGTPASSVNRGSATSIRIQPDPTQNALLISATARDMKRIDEVLRRLDLKVRQVHVQMVRLEVDLHDYSEFDMGRFLSSLGAVQADGSGYVFPTSLDDVLRALQANANVKGVSSQSVLVENNRSANLHLGDKVPVLSQTSRSLKSPSAPIISSVTSQNTGHSLTVTPTIGVGGNVSLKLVDDISTANRNTLTNVQSPILSERYLDSTISTHSGNTIVLASAVQDYTNRADSGIPGLMDIPVLGALFHSTKTINDRTTLLALLNVRVVESESDAQALTNEVRETVHNLSLKLKPAPAPARREGR